MSPNFSKFALPFPSRVPDCPSFKVNRDHVEREVKRCLKVCKPRFVLPRSSRNVRKVPPTDKSASPFVFCLPEEDELNKAITQAVDATTYLERSSSEDGLMIVHAEMVLELLTDVKQLGEHLRGSDGRWELIEDAMEKVEEGIIRERCRRNFARSHWLHLGPSERSILLSFSDGLLADVKFEVCQKAVKGESGEVCSTKGQVGCLCRECEKDFGVPPNEGGTKGEVRWVSREVDFIVHRWEAEKKESAFTSASLTARSLLCGASGYKYEYAWHLLHIRETELHNLTYAVSMWRYATVRHRILLSMLNALSQLGKRPALPRVHEIAGSYYDQLLSLLQSSNQWSCVARSLKCHFSPFVNAESRWFSRVLKMEIRNRHSLLRNLAKKAIDRRKSAHILEATLFTFVNSLIDRLTRDKKLGHQTHLPSPQRAALLPEMKKTIQDAAAKVNNPVARLMDILKDTDTDLHKGYILAPPSKFLSKQMDRGEAALDLISQHLIDGFEPDLDIDNPFGSWSRSASPPYSPLCSSFPKNDDSEEEEEGELGFGRRPESPRKGEGGSRLFSWGPAWEKEREKAARQPRRKGVGLPSPCHSPNERSPSPDPDSDAALLLPKFEGNKPERKEMLGCMGEWAREGGERPASNQRKPPVHPNRMAAASANMGRVPFGEGGDRRGGLQRNGSGQIREAPARGGRGGEALQPPRIFTGPSSSPSPGDESEDEEVSPSISISTSENEGGWRWGGQEEEEETDEDGGQDEEDEEDEEEDGLDCSSDEEEAEEGDEMEEEEKGEELREMLRPKRNDTWAFPRASGHQGACDDEEEEEEDEEGSFCGSVRNPSPSPRKERRFFAEHSGGEFGLGRRKRELGGRFTPSPQTVRTPSCASSKSPPGPRWSFPKKNLCRGLFDCTKRQCQTGSSNVSSPFHGSPMNFSSLNPHSTPDSLSPSPTPHYREEEEGECGRQAVQAPDLDCGGPLHPSRGRDCVGGRGGHSTGASATAAAGRGGGGKGRLPHMTPARTSGGRRVVGRKGKRSGGNRVGNSPQQQQQQQRESAFTQTDQSSVNGLDISQFAEQTHTWGGGTFDSRQGRRQGDCGRGGGQERGKKGGMTACGAVDPDAFLHSYSTDASASLNMSAPHRLSGGRAQRERDVRLLPEGGGGTRAGKRWAASVTEETYEDEDEDEEEACLKTKVKARLEAERERGGFGCVPGFQRRLWKDKGVPPSSEQRGARG
uniref:Uncharacterized protein n=1 Tax=Chromera velia CCMP2878 TaxID=1169474 RepID=A0A0G4F3N9_9ALVE|eukprot:Cvel_14943.t1-p1 / transcript=Cvel_14943.t1 / gene=Cvel_14943 / organism=Chromera_velia_CCMP2878 / gene_product=hypothetical protein / transcript_product=hypothetical protein / location=Cvel_scaffold1084:19049-23834(+) / protein_length=1221 / sequence_SO=supercontig / SO=protein_coding / is_pseudo=false